jgi:hypothetical protein
MKKNLTQMEATVRKSYHELKLLLESCYNRFSKTSDSHAFGAPITFHVTTCYKLGPVQYLKCL